MAKIHEETIIIHVSKLVKNDEQLTEILDQDIVQSLESVTQELVGPGIVIEVEKK